MRRIGSGWHLNALDNLASGSDWVKIKIPSTHMVANTFNTRVWLSQILNAVKEALFPVRCLSCGLFFDAAADRLDDQPERFFKDKSTLLGSKPEMFKWALAPYICPDCANNFRPVEPPLCFRCGRMFQSREGDDHCCGECLEKPKRFRRARAFGVYDQVLMEGIHRFKYKGKIQLSRPLGILLLGALSAYWDDDPPDLVVSVPLHAARFRERGFNQSFMLIRDWPRMALALPVPLRHIALDREVLVRNRWTEPQTGLGRGMRQQNIKNAFDVRDENRVFQKKILLVDDVYTTGATVNECAGALLRAGADWVDVLTLARTM